MLGYHDLAGSPEPCRRCGSTSDDCDWLTREARCATSCDVCHGGGAARCGHCDEVVPCGAIVGRNPRPDATCAWIGLAALHAAGCAWASTRGGEIEPLAAALRPI
ncbi:MAG: hypothetical protein K8T90_14395 [Planctomycetes bacterium]|nr:hypothetical protein [Planctomycetota bacterium]